MGHLICKEIFWLGPSLTLWWLFKVGNRQALMDDFAAIFPWNPCNLGLEWTFWTFSVLKIIILSLPVWWTLKFCDSSPFWSCGSCFKSAVTSPQENSRRRSVGRQKSRRLLAPQAGVFDFLEGGLKGNDPQNCTLEVKTVKARKQCKSLQKWITLVSPANSDLPSIVMSEWNR